MEVFLQQLSNGLAIGGIYALIALGYTMVYGVLRLINFAHGDLFTSGAFLGYTFLVTLALGQSNGKVGAILMVILLVMGVAAFLGYVLERSAYRPLRKSNRLNAVVSAIGASIVIQNSIMLIYGPQVLVFPAGMKPNILVEIFDLKFPLMRFFLFGASILLMLVLYFFINRTRLGTAIRAVAIDQDASRLMGIDVSQIISLMFMIGAALGGAAGAMVGIYYGQITFTMGWIYGLKAFTAAIMGGIGNIPGAMLGGILLGVVENMAAAYISSGWKDAIAFLVLILILIFRPTGILGERVAEKI
jgi:branched-chain amino acid transport system permease protein